MLFKEGIRTYSDIRTRGISASKILDISAWPIAALIRDYFNEWGALLEGDKEFIKMFFSNDDKQHYSAVFELLLATILSRSGFDLAKISHTTGKRPDFKVSHEKIPELYLECTLAGNSYESLEEKNKKETVEEVIEGLIDFNYFVNVEIKSTSDHSIVKRKVVHFLSAIAKTLDGLSDEAVRNERHMFKDSGWFIEFSFIRKTSPDIKRSLGIMTGEAKIIDSPKPIYNALNDKRPSKYKTGLVPFVVCLNTSDPFIDQFSFADALFGYPAYDIPVPKSERGFLLAYGNPINTSTSAVLFSRRLDLFTLDKAEISIWHNPYASAQLPKGFSPFTEHHYTIQGDMLKKHTIERSTNLFELLGINEQHFLELKYRQSALKIT